jgi:hypothetical protein
MAEKVDGSSTASPYFAKELQELETALRNCSRQIHMVKPVVLLTLLVGILVVWIDLQPDQSQLHHESDKLNSAWYLICS